MPNPLPVMVLGRMAVEQHHAGAGLGKAMLREAMRRALEASEKVGARALVVHAIDAEAVPFSTQFGSQIFPIRSLTLFLPTETIAAALYRLTTLALPITAKAPYSRPSALRLLPAPPPWPT